MIKINTYNLIREVKCMENKKPKVFANPVEKNIGNNERVFYSHKESVASNNENVEDDSFRGSSERKLANGKNINQKINDVFNSSRYVYKADVEITLKDGVVNKRVIGRNANHLITIDNELIPISDIVDIKYK